ncbi:hypothetical protein [Aquimarina litoralis]|uniref:hypothetical protein n=1 Tax=Aquimarina litoralis TaxID=584605 RepID=UPI001C5885C8|nr:hypothetical protein [Aquimarina litoralis]MBW1298749.1 hypothetical protein [Aquimarina litoralis]
MRLLLITIITLLTSYISFSQDTTNKFPRDINKNEIGINPINIIAFAALDVSYERVLTSNNSIGVDLFYRFSEDIDNDGDIVDRDGIFDKKLAITGHYKYFFGSRVARGFYLEGFGMLSTGDSDNTVRVLNTDGELTGFRDISEDFTDFALGFGVGGKFVTKNGFFLDIGFGIGRNLFSDKSPEIIVRPNLYLGYRF